MASIFQCVAFNFPFFGDSCIQRGDGGEMVTNGSVVHSRNFALHKCIRGFVFFNAFIIEIFY